MVFKYYSISSRTPPPHLLLLKYYTELHDIANLSSAGMFETDLETQSPTHWLCLLAPFFQPHLKIPKKGMKTTILEMLKP